MVICVKFCYLQFEMHGTCKILAVNHDSIGINYNVIYNNVYNNSGVSWKLTWLTTRMILQRNLVGF